MQLRRAIGGRDFLVGDGWQDLVVDIEQSGGIVGFANVSATTNATHAELDAPGH